MHRKEKNMTHKEYPIEVGDGWKHLYQPVLDYIEKYNKEHTDNPIEVWQIKEKYAGLRIYVSRGTKELFDMIGDAESKSYNTCEECGKYIEGAKVRNGWYYALCDECFDKRLNVCTAK